MRSDTVSVDSAAASLEGVDDIHCGDGLPLRVLAEHSRVLDYDAEEVVDEVPGLIIHIRADSLDSSASGQPADTSSRQSIGWCFRDFGPLD